MKPDPSKLLKEALKLLGRAKPNAQAALLINLVRQYPDTVQRLAVI